MTSCPHLLEKIKLAHKPSDELANPSNIVHPKQSLNSVVVATYMIKYGGNEIEVFLNTFRRIIDKIYLIFSF